MRRLVTTDRLRRRLAGERCASHAGGSTALAIAFEREFATSSVIVVSHATDAVLASSAARTLTRCCDRRGRRRSSGCASTRHAQRLGRTRAERPRLRRQSPAAGRHLAASPLAGSVAKRSSIGAQRSARSGSPLATAYERIASASRRQIAPGRGRCAKTSTCRSAACATETAVPGAPQPTRRLDRAGGAARAPRARPSRSGRRGASHARRAPACQLPAAQRDAADLQSPRRSSTLAAAAQREPMAPLRQDDSDVAVAELSVASRDKRVAAMGVRAGAMG